MLLLAEIERVDIEICGQWIRNNITPVSMAISDKESTKHDHDYRAMESIHSGGTCFTNIRGGERDAFLEAIKTIPMNSGKRNRKQQKTI